MEQVLFSEGLPKIKDEITNQRLVSTVASLNVLVPDQELTLRIWDDERVAVSIALPISLPQFGPVENIKINEQEPVLLVFDRANYPYRAPRVYVDRLDFPKDKVGHMYVATKGRPPGLCLVRGSIDEWYANRQIGALIARIRNWFCDAATGALVENGEEFEPLRLEGYVGSLHYDYDEVFTIIGEKKSYLPANNFAKALFERITSTDKSLSWRFIEEVTFENLESKVHEMSVETDKNENTAEKKYLYFGYILWADSQRAVYEYNTNLPATWSELKQFCSTYRIKIEDFEREIIISKNLRVYTSVPIIVAIKRSKKLIGFSGDIEFINFHLSIPWEEIIDGKISESSAVHFKQHEQPLTIQKAREISGQNDIILGVSIVAGCGALGSRILLHLAKSGYTNYIIADNDKLMPHNFVRHPLSAKYVNQNKAVALKKELDLIYTGVKIAPADAPIALNVNADALVEIASKKGLFKRILDFTASPVFSQKLVDAKLPHEIEILKAYLSDLGTMGILLVEGFSRNPRIDDLQALLYNEAVQNNLVAGWLIREAEVAEKTSNITIGVGCNSETTILSDEEIACHAAILTKILRQEIVQKKDNSGKVYINKLYQIPFFHSDTMSFTFGKLDCLKAVNDSSWEVRFANELHGKIKQQMFDAMPNETGGVLVGSCNFKTRTIHVTMLIDAPSDSRSNHACFFRGINGLANKIDIINENSGGQIGYIGEWHSHPKGPEDLSDIDMSTVAKFKKEYLEQSSSLPVLLTIVTPNSILPFVY